MSVAPTAAAAPTIDAVLRFATAELASHCDSPRLDAELLLAEVLDCSRGQLRARGDWSLSADCERRFHALLQRRRAGEPVAYLLQRREFWSLDLRVSRAVLIPRPETELLVERSLLRLHGRIAPRVLDLGTGSGAIALALAHERRDAVVTATDSSTAALALATDNAQRLHLTNVSFVCGDWFAPLAGQRFDLIVSNPPYVAVGDSDLQATVAAHEPASALYAAEDGLADLAAICAVAPEHLTSGGTLLLEHGATQGDAVSALLRSGGFADIETWPDLAGHPRVSGGHIA